MTAEEQWAAGYRIKKRYENKYRPLFYRAIKEQKAPTIEVAKSQGAAAAFATIPFVPIRPMQAAYRKFYLAVVPHEADRSYASLSRVKAFGVNLDWLADIEEFLAQYMLDNIVRKVTATTQRLLLDALNQGLANGDSNDEIVRAMAGDEVDATRARLIARTEATRATNWASQLGADKHDFKTVKVWLSAKDWRTRGAKPKDGADHLHLHLARADEFGVFTDPRNGQRLLFPGDSTLGAQSVSVCNCRCSVRNEAVRDADGQLVMK